MFNILNATFHLESGQGLKVETRLVKTIHMTQITNLRDKWPHKDERSLGFADRRFIDQLVLRGVNLSPLFLSFFILENHESFNLPTTTFSSSSSMIS